MQTKPTPFVRKRTMITADAIAEQARPFAVALVQTAEPRTGSRMRAYEHVAATVGVSASWLRKLIGRQHVVIAAHEYLNLADAYRSLCEQIEAKAAQEQQQAAVLRETLDALLSCTSIVVESPKGKAAAGEAYPRSTAGEA